MLFCQTDVVNTAKARSRGLKIPHLSTEHSQWRHLAAGQNSAVDRCGNGLKVFCHQQYVAMPLPTVSIGRMQY